MCSAPNTTQCQVWERGFRVSDSGFLGFRLQGLGCSAKDLKILGSGCTLRVPWVQLLRRRLEHERLCHLSSILFRDIMVPNILTKMISLLWVSHLM